MSNSNIEALTPEFWLNAFDELDKGNFTLQNYVSRDVERTIASVGDTVNVPVIPEVEAAKPWDPANEPSISDIHQETIPVKLDQSFTNGFKLNSKDLSRKPYDLIAQYGVPHAQEILRTINERIYMELLKAPYHVDATANLNEDTLTDAKTQLSKRQIALFGRNMFADPDDIGELLKKDAFKFYNLAGTNEAQVEGLITRKSGWNLFENHAIDRYTPDDLIGALDGNFLQGGKSIVVNGFNDSAKKIRPGDVFKIAGETGSKFHTVQSVTPDAGNTTTITFELPLESNVTTGSAVLFQATRSMVGFVPNAIAFAARTYDKLPSGIGIFQSVEIIQGIPVRVNIMATPNIGVRVTFDILFGVKLINNKRVVRILR